LVFGHCTYFTPLVSGQGWVCAGTLCGVNKSPANARGSRTVLIDLLPCETGFIDLIGMIRMGYITFLGLWVPLPGRG
jgi:hypothetical protein